MVIYETRLKSGIVRTREFERKKLASFAVNVGTKCGHGCRYCSSGALLRMHASFREHGKNPFETGYAIIDPDTPQRVARDAHRMRARGVIQLSTTVDAWAPEAQQHDLGRRCLEAILREPGWTIRILTKNAAVTRDFDLIEKYRDRVLVGLSITAPAERSDVLAVIEPNASVIPDRIAALREAHARGLRTYAMFCPLLPGIADSAKDIEELMTLAAGCRAEEVFVEPVNARGPGLRKTQAALRMKGYFTEAEAVAQIRRTNNWSAYVERLICRVQDSARRLLGIEKLRILLYPSRLMPEHRLDIEEDDAGVIWLSKGP